MVMGALGYQYLQAMGITCWVPQTIVEHARYQIVLDAPTYFSHCLWVCAINAPSQENLSLSHKSFHIHPVVKTVQAMQKMVQTTEIICSALYVVVNLPLQQWQAADWQNIREKIQQFFPRQVLLLGESLSQGLLETDFIIDRLRMQSHTLCQTPCYVTFDPDHFIQFPVDKRKAYQDLCRLKKTLEENRCKLSCAQ